MHLTMVETCTQPYYALGMRLDLLTMRGDAIHCGWEVHSTKLGVELMLFLLTVDRWCTQLQ